jgi:hypothetical protein
LRLVDQLRMRLNRGDVGLGATDLRLRDAESFGHGRLAVRFRARAALEGNLIQFG